MIRQLDDSSPFDDTLRLKHERDEAIVRIAELEAVLRRIAEGDEPRPVGKVWNTDGTPSKHDKCIHDRWMYEDCGQCISDFAAAKITATLGDEG